MSFIYKNLAETLVNIKGYQFAPGQELVSNIEIKVFKEAIDKGILGLVANGQIATPKGVKKDTPVKPKDNAPPVKKDDGSSKPESKPVDNMNSGNSPSPEENTASV